ncbi:polysaccharide biosynthesis protein cpsM [Vibrio sp. JCM 19236]|nr:polysaccharide biosynthesis protein cpsM [Vibrio sp. JCM 19236]
MNRYKNLSVNTFLVFIGNLGGKLISFLMLPFYTSWLSVSDYGIVDMVTLYSSIILSISSCCLTESIFVFSKNENNENRKKYFTSGVIFVTSVFIILMLIVYLIEGFYSDSRVNNVFISYTFEIYFLVVVNFYQQFFLQFARSIGKIKIYAVSGVLLTALIAVFSFIFIPDHGIFGFIYAQICSTVFTSIYTMISSRSYAYFKISSVSFERCTEMLRYSIL